MTGAPDEDEATIEERIGYSTERFEISSIGCDDYGQKCDDDDDGHKGNDNIKDEESRASSNSFKSNLMF